MQYSVECNSFKPINGKVFIKTDKNKKNTIKHGSLTLLKDERFMKYHHDEVVQDGNIMLIQDKKPK